MSFESHRGAPPARPHRASVERLAAELDGEGSVAAKCAAWNEVARLLPENGGLMRPDDEARPVLEPHRQGRGMDRRFAQDLEDFAIGVLPGVPLEPQVHLRPDMRVGIASRLAHVLDLMRLAA